MSSNDLMNLFSNAAEDGMSQASVGIMVNNLNPLTIAGAQGASIDDLAGDEVTLYVRVIDRSSSIQFGGFKTPIIESANRQLTALEASKASDSILMSTWFFNDQPSLLHSYVPLNQVLRFDSSNYQPSGSTALFDSFIYAITSAVAYVQTLKAAGIRVQVTIVGVSDGEDNTSQNTAAAVKTLVEDLFKQEIYTVAMVAVGAHGKSVAAQMGIPPGNLLEVGDDESAIRRAFNEMSKSVIRASQTVIGANNSSSFFS